MHRPGNVERTIQPGIPVSFLRVLVFVSDKSCGRAAGRRTVAAVLLRSEFEKDTTRLLQRQTVIFRAVPAGRFSPQFSTIRQHAGVSVVKLSIRLRSRAFPTGQSYERVHHTFHPFFLHVDSTR